MQQQIKSPVLLIVFNRPDTTRLVFDAIRRARPAKLYIAADAPREGNAEDIVKCNEVLNIVSCVDWDCEVHKRVAHLNQGCGPGPFNAISWVFETEDRAIILEDDCVPALSFFPYCDELLERYKDDTRIWLISGNQYNEEAVTTQYSYFFSKYGHSQGWATWSRCIKNVDLAMNKWPLLKSQDLFKSVFSNEKERAFFEKIFNKAYLNRDLSNHSWDIQMSLSFRYNNALSIVPIKNLVKNIGYIGTHSDRKLWFHNRNIDESFSIKTHPDFILCDVDYDTYHFNHHWNRRQTLFYRVLRKIVKMIKHTKIK